MAVSLIENENEYDDGAYTRATNDLANAVANLWNAGASLDNLESELEMALENATGRGVLISVIAASGE
jgi:hypothetical protein